MNEKAYKTLEYGKIINRLTEFAGSSLGAERCKNTFPLTDIKEIKRLQRETSDAYVRLMKKGSVSFSGIPDIRASVKRLEVEATLGAGELLKISALLTAALRVKNYGNTVQEKSESHHPAWKLEMERLAEKKAAELAKEEAAGKAGELTNNDISEEVENQDSLAALFLELEPLSPLNNEIRRCILSEEEIADDASSGLKSVRRAIKNTNDKIREQLGSIMNSQTTRGMMQDALITMRNGRFCLPIKSEFKGQFQGMVHDQSSSGSTVFIEPMVIVKLNNELRELAIREQEEIEKVLQELSRITGQEAGKLGRNQQLLTELDYIFARAALSKSMRGTEPILNEERYINIKKGRHPLIDKNKVVPIDIRIGKEFSLLVITGPNTGGKTVSLKTVGLFTLMGQAGLHIPASEGSELGIFKEVFADIGDEQSIEQSLSTFSSHMTNTVSILKQANYESLVLFDELGAGTDPTEGAALAMAILSTLHKKTVRTIATTHYSELKVYALTTEGVSNACCEFNVETLQPTYRLLIGIPGKSNAFAISMKLGLPEYIVNDAKNRIGKQEKSFEDIISEMEDDKRLIENEKEEILRMKTEIASLNEKLTQKNEKLEASRERILQEAKEKARDIYQEAKDYADETIRKINKLGSGAVGRELEAERAALRERIGDAGEDLRIRQKKKAGKNEPEALKPGDTVLVLSLNLKGKVSTAPNAKGDLYVQMGALRSLVNISDLETVEPDEEEQEKKRTDAGKIKMSKSLNIRPEINLIGMRVDEALPELDKYLDDCYLAHLEKATIIHGRGTGALKEAVHAHLKRTKYIKAYRLGEFGEGDRGVTIVEFKTE